MYLGQTNVAQVWHPANPNLPLTIVCRKGNYILESSAFKNLQEDLTGFMAAASKFQIKGLSEDKVSGSKV